jgi:hypothetical protein
LSSSAPTASRPEARPTGPIRRVLRGLWLATLLLGPLIAAEGLARSSIGELLPHMRTYHSASDAKKLLFDARERCPDVLALGTSLTDRTLFADNIVGLEVEPGRAIADPFDFGAGGMRPENLLMAWQHVRRRGCVPDLVFVELNPIVFNTEDGGAVHDVAFLGLPTYLAMPAGFADFREHDVDRIAEMSTWNRLLIKRRRREILRTIGRVAGLEMAFSSPKSKEAAKKRKKRKKKRFETLPLDGHIRSTPRATLKGKRAEKERRRRFRNIRKGTFQHHYADYHRVAFDHLLAEIEDSGARLILHTPPNSEIFRDVIEEMGQDEHWCAIVGDYAAREGVEWFNEYSSSDYALEEFFDWTHLGPAASQRYARALMAAVRDRDYPHEPYCD